MFDIKFLGIEKVGRWNEKVVFYVLCFMLMRLVYLKDNEMCNIFIF